MYVCLSVSPFVCLFVRMSENFAHGLLLLGRSNLRHLLTYRLTVEQSEAETHTSLVQEEDEDQSSRLDHSE